jgi:transposase
MRRFELTDEQWKLIEPVLPKQRRGGRVPMPPVGATDLPGRSVHHAGRR